MNSLCGTKIANNTPQYVTFKFNDKNYFTKHIKNRDYFLQGLIYKRSQNSKTKMLENEVTSKEHIFIENRTIILEKE